MNICPQCKSEFKPKNRIHKFCKKSCYYIFNGDIYKNRAAEKILQRKENPIYPKYIDDNGVEHQLDFDPSKDHNRFNKFKQNLKTPD